MQFTQLEQNNISGTTQMRLLMPFFDVSWDKVNQSMEFYPRYIIAYPLLYPKNGKERMWIRL
jgi:hypothetical protein